MKTFQVAAASALTFAALAASPASAALLSKTFDQTLDNGNFTTASSLTRQFDFNGDGVNDFSFTHTTSKPGYSPTSPNDYNGRLYFDSATPSQFLSVVKDYDTTGQGNISSPLGNYVETLPAGYSIGGNGLNGFIQVSPGVTAYDDRLFDSGGTGNYGAFSVATGERNPLVGDTAYVGFAFGDPANPTYGYLYFTNIASDDNFNQGDRNAATLSQVVYQTTPGVPVIVPGSPSVPEPTTLAAVVGGLSLAAVRRRRTV